MPKNIERISPVSLNIKSPYEGGKTFGENSEIKADFFCKKSKLITLSDDSGLEIDYLDKNNMSSVGFSIISNQRKHLAEKEQAIIQFIELKLLGRGEIMNIIYDENKI